jgi:hypothetical protein
VAVCKLQNNFFYFLEKKKCFGGGKFLATDFLKFRLHFLAQNFAPSMQSFGGGKFLATDFLKFRLHFLAQNFAPSMQKFWRP